MLSKYLKKTLVFSAFAVGIFGFVLSCDNPFSSSLGSKVDVENPAIKVDSPAPGAFIQNVAVFSGLADAYRELRRVEFRLLDPNDPLDEESNPTLPLLFPQIPQGVNVTEDDTWIDITGANLPRWMTSSGINALPEWISGTLVGGAKEKNWTLSIDTLAFTYTVQDDNGNSVLKEGLDDGFLKIQFRARDPNLKTQSAVMVYIVKNGPSRIRVTSPAEIPTDTELLGNVIDRRGIKPGYPMIKIWPDTMSEPAGDDPNWGWTSLFVSGIDNIDTWNYAADPPRTARAVTRTANFSFKLSKFSIDRTDPAFPRTIYERSEEGESFLPLETGMYFYRIMTYDTFFYDDPNNQANYMFARSPQGDEVETLTFYKEEEGVPNTWDSGPFDQIKVVTAGERPRIALNNSDIDEAVLNQAPNIYINESTVEKIKKASDRSLDTVIDKNADKFKDFRLRIVATHPEGINNATLRWEHSAGGTPRGSYLKWDGASGEAEAEEGYSGVWDTALQGTVFTFTAFNDLTYTDDKGNVDKAFKSSTEPYSLIVRVYSTGAFAEEKYTLYLNEKGPTVGIRSIQGAYDSPQTDAVNVLIGDVVTGTFNDSPYTVNGNIQVTITRETSTGYMQQTQFNKADYPVVKWAVEEVDPTTAGSIYNRLINFHEDPTTGTLAFFHDKEIFGENNSSGVDTMNGWITESETGDYLRLSTREKWPGTKTLWLYVIVQDRYHNLGYAVQKLYVDQSTDKPRMEVPILYDIASTVPDTNPALTIANPDDLYIALNGNNPNRVKINVLSGSDSIDLNFADDDGIKPSEITIKITEHNTGAIKTVTGDAMVGNDTVLREWDGRLSQSVLAAALYGAGAGIPTSLKDGIYSLTITVPDHVGAKVQIGAVAETSANVSQTFHFVVQSREPEIEVLRPRGQNTRQTSDIIEVFGTVRSRLKIQRLVVVFTPDLATNVQSADNDYGCKDSGQLLPELYVKGTIGNHADGFNKVLNVVPNDLIGGIGGATWKDVEADSDGYYNYYWRIKDVSFDPVNGLGESILFPPGNPVDRFDWRRFDLTGWDGLGDAGVAACTVDVDTTPPEVELLEFNYERLDVKGNVTVNGKVPFEINAYDPNKIGKGDITIPGSDPFNDWYLIKWWVLPAGWIDTTPDNNGSSVPIFETPFPGEGETGGGGLFYDSITSKYKTIFDVTDAAKYPSNKYLDVDGIYKYTPYNLYVIAIDEAGNANTATSLKTFVVDPDSDYPVQRPEIPMEPEDGKSVGRLSSTTPVTAIKGTVVDDDGFDKDKLDDGNYVKIKFDTGTRQNPNWGQWIPITNNGAGNSLERNSIGDLEFVFDLNTDLSHYGYNPNYLKTDGEKRYQISVTDEMDAGVNKDPPGKNPDDVVTIRTVTAYLPGPAENAGFYSFTLKDTPPLVFFANYDPVKFTDVNGTPIRHPGYKEGDSNYKEGDRPSFKDVINRTDGVVTIEGLKTVLNSGWVQEPTLDGIYFTYGSGVDRIQNKFVESGVVSREDFLLGNYTSTPGTYFTTKDGDDNDIHVWTIGDDWLGTDNADPTLKTGFYAGATGMQYSITIEAIDTLGNSRPVDWTFWKDTVGPIVNFNNISTSKALTVSGVAGNIYITGQFNDANSNVKKLMDYRFDNDDWKTDQVITATGTGGTWNGKSANWSVPIPGNFEDDPDDDYDIVFPDGKHKFSIRIKDELGNDSEVQYIDIEFIVDRRAPEMITKVDGLNAKTRIIIKGGITGVPENGYLLDRERVFSAAFIDRPGYNLDDTLLRVHPADPTTEGDKVVFTLSGMVFEHNLTQLRASIRNTSAGDSLADIKLDKIIDSAVAWSEVGSVTTWFGNGTGTNEDYYGDGTVMGNGLTNSTFRIRRAVKTQVTPPVTGDFGLIATDDDVTNRYVWELDIRERDFYNLIKDLTNGRNNDSERRSITITAQDSALTDSIPEVWDFYLDSTPPMIELSNLTGRPLDGYTINLQGRVQDKTKVKTIEYKIDKYDYATGIWSYWTNVAGDGWVTYLNNGTTETVFWEIPVPDTTDKANDGRYRFSIRATDYSLSASAAGNLTFAPGYSNVEFYIDRKEPEITWVSDRKSYYRWEDTWDDDDEEWVTTNQIVLNLSVEDANTIDNANDKLAGELRDSNNALAGTVTVSAATPNLISSNVTVTIGNTGPFAPLANGNYTLTLTIMDKTGRTASLEHTLAFYLDNDKPTISIDPNPVNNEAITGRVTLQSEFSKLHTDDSSITRVAYRVDTGPTPTVPDLSDIALKTAQWKFYDENEDNYELTFGSDTSQKRLMAINKGIDVVNLLIYNTRYFKGTTGLQGPDVKVGTDIGSGLVKFNGVAIPDGGIINKLTIHLLAIDDAGNHNVESYDYWIYPAGDIPVVNITNPDKNDNLINRQLNGTIKISGTATDNYRIQRVWFRVLKDGYTGTDYDNDADVPLNYRPELSLRIPEWDDFWNAKSATQKVNNNNSSLILDGTNYGTGWFIANGGGGKNITWWAQINTNGELDPLDTSRSIIIQAIAEDTIWLDDVGEYATTDCLPSPLKEVDAAVVSGAPVFEGEYVKSAASSDTTVEWGEILKTAVKGRASYQVTVRHGAGVSAIRWTNPSLSGINSATNILNDTTWAAQIAAINTTGIAIKAEPLHTLTGVTLTANKIYMVWEWGSGALAGFDGLPSGSESPTTANQRYKTFSPTAAQASINIGDAVVLERVGTTDENFEYLVTVDINSSVLNAGYYNGKAEYHTLNLVAEDISKPVALPSRHFAQIPIDNLPPEGNYTHTTNIAGTAQSFGGEAADSEGDVKGLSRVVLWFSRKINGVETSVPWNEKQSGAKAFNSYIGTTPTGIVNIDIGKNELPANVILPRIPALNLVDAQDAPDVNNTCIVIDRPDPLSRQIHHGHNLAMGWVASGGVTKWYVSLNSTYMESGRVTAHFIVYDSAGNGTYYNQKLMVLNNVPKISRITLATDIGTKTADLRTALGTANVHYDENATPSVMNKIRTAMGTSAAAAGISEPVTIDSSKPGIYGVVIDEKDFMVRNGLLAIKVDTDVPQTSDEKPRHYRVEYVSGVREISGVADLIKNDKTSPQSGIRAGKVYIINTVASGFPWGALGAHGDTYYPGQVFLAMVNGDEIELRGTITGTPSVWELNGNYYQYDDDDDDVELDENEALGRTVASDLAFSSGSDVVYAKLDSPDPTGITNKGKTAEFVYGADAFSTDPDDAGDKIIDFVPYLDGTGRPVAYPASGADPHIAQSLFIIKIFDGPESELFGDFALLSVRVNNADKTPSYAQLYDLNPNTEATNPLLPGTPGQMGANRAKGGLQTTGTGANAVKSGHIEPRKNTGLSSSEMGGAASSTASTITRPYANAAAFFDYDTVSGQVIVRGYAEDNQRIGQVDLVFTGTSATTVTILTNRGAAGSANKYFLQAGTDTNANDRVDFTETVDLNRHRVEWTYYWDTETVPANTFVVGDVTVRAVAHNANTDSLGTNETQATNRTSAVIAHNNTLSATAPTSGVSTTWDYFNPSYPSQTNPASRGHYQRYNSITVHLRPYITGFKRDTTAATPAHNTRSRQGRYMFARGETNVAVTGFNLGLTGSTTTIFLPGYTATNDTSATATGTSNSRTFTVPTTATTSDATYGNGTVRLRVTRGATGTRYYWAVNTAASTDATGTGDNAAGARPRVTIGNISRPVVQPWNMERNTSINGSDLWDDFTSVHIWQSEDTNNNTASPDAATFGNSRFPATANWVIMNPAMSIDPATGNLYASHNEGGTGTSGTTDTVNGDYNSGNTKLGNNNNTAIAPQNQANSLANSPDAMKNVTQFRDPIVMSDVYRSPGGTDDATAGTWTAYSIIGRSGTGSTWDVLGGIYIHGPGGQRVDLAGSNSGTTYVNNSIYIGESTWYNASSSSGTVAPTPTTDQFENPHIVTYTNGATERIHVSYYDSKDGSVKYRYNLRGSPGWTGNFDGTNATNRNNMRTWINLDGGFDDDDLNTVAATSVPEDYTLQQAYNANTTGGNLNNRYLRTVHIANGATVTAGQLIYTLGVTSVTDNLGQTEIYAARDGTISNLLTVTTGGAQTFANSVAGANNSNVAWAVSNATTEANRNNYIREVGAANNTYVTAGQVIYRFGRQSRTDNTNQLTITAKRSGIITGLQYTTAMVTQTGNYTRPTGLAATGTPNVGFTIGTSVYENAADTNWGANDSGVAWAVSNATTEANRNNYIREVGAAINTYVTEGQVIYRFGRQSRTDNTNQLTITAQRSGIITGLSYTAAMVAQTGNYTRPTGLAATGTPNVGFTISNTYTNQIDTNTRAYTITYVVPPDLSNAGARVVNYSARDGATNPDVGQHNAIATTSQGYPVVAYFDKSSQRLKLAVSRAEDPTTSADWVIRDYVIPSTNPSGYGTGEYVSIKVDTRDGPNKDRVHIAALNSMTKQLVYITGMLYPTRGTANAVHTTSTVDNSNVLPASTVTVQVVDSVGDVGRWSQLSLDVDGNPWISYQDESYRGSRDGVKVAYKNTGTFYKGVDNGTASFFVGKDMDINGEPIGGWEAMHVPTRYRVNDARLGMENYPTRNFTGTKTVNERPWTGAVSYLAPDYYRIAYYVK